MDTLGLIIAVVVMAASAALVDRVVEHTPTVTKAWVDAGFKDDVQIHGAINGIDVEQVKRPNSGADTKPGFVPVAKRWIVEQVHGTLMLHRRLVREYELPRDRDNTRPGQRPASPAPGGHRPRTSSAG